MPTKNFKWLDFENIWEQGEWYTEEVIWLLFGDHGLTAINSIRSRILPEDRTTDFVVKDYYDKFLKAIRSGRFGEVRHENLLRFYGTHPLKVIDWFEDEKILEDLSSDSTHQSHPRLKELIEDWNQARGKPREELIHDIGYINFAKKHLCAKSQFRILLFDQLYAWQYLPLRYHRYNPPVEKLMYDLDQEIDQAVMVGRITEPKAPFGDFIVINEYSYITQELLTEIEHLCYPVPEGLLEARKQGEWDKAEELLRRLHENMKVFVEREGNISKKEFEGLVKTDYETHGPSTERQGQAEIRIEEENVFLKEGDFWRIRFKKGGVSAVKHTNGMAYIYHLLMSSMEAIPALDLYKGENTLPNPAEIGYEDLINSPQLDGISADDDTVLDKDGIVFLRKEMQGNNQKIVALEEELEEAKTLKTSDKKEDIEHEIYELKNENSIIEQQINNNILPGGTLKKFTDTNEQARSKVAHAVQRAIKNIAGHDPALADHLMKKIKIGVKCHYQDSIIWKVQ